MAYKVLEDGRAVLDWETGDDDGNRKYLFQAYQDFIKELLLAVEMAKFLKLPEAYNAIDMVIKKWKISVDNQVDDFPRIWIKRPN